MSTLESIKAILSEQVNTYRSLQGVLQRERECLVHFNAPGVETLSKEKDTIVLKLRLLEEERISLVQAYCREQNLEGTLVLQQLSERTGDESFQKLRLQLLSLLQAIVELNEFNRVLIERSSGVVKSALGFLSALGTDFSAKTRGALVSKEA